MEYVLITFPIKYVPLGDNESSIVQAMTLPVPIMTQYNDTYTLTYWPLEDMEVIAGYVHIHLFHTISGTTADNINVFYSTQQPMNITINDMND